MDSANIKELAADYTLAWNSKSAASVASFFAADGSIIINKGEPWLGRSRVQDMAQGFYDDVPDLHLVCDDVRASANHVA